MLFSSLSSYDQKYKQEDFKDKNNRIDTIVREEITDEINFDSNIETDKIDQNIEKPKKKRIKKRKKKILSQFKKIFCVFIFFFN